MATSRGAAVKAAVFARCQVLFPAPVVTSYGLSPEAIQAVQEVGDVVMVGDVGSLDQLSGEQVVATMSPQRTREETVFVSVAFSVADGGVDQKTTTERAFALFGLLENDLRTDPTIAGACRTADVASWQLTETDVDELHLGRNADVLATIRCRTRI